MAARLGSNFMTAVAQQFQHRWLIASRLRLGKERVALLVVPGRRMFRYVWSGTVPFAMDSHFKGAHHVGTCPVSTMNQTYQTRHSIDATDCWESGNQTVLQMDLPYPVR